MHTTPRKAIVMGATSGIGREVALLLARTGWKVGIAGRRENLLKELAETHANIETYTVIDVCSSEAEAELLKLVKRMEGIDLYLHSSGVGFQNPDLDAEKEIATAETNTVGVTRLVGAMFRHFAAHPERHAHLAVISSIAGTRALGAAPAYSASKRYVNHYMECLRQLCTIRGIRHLHLHDVRPGFVRTELISGGSYPMQMTPEHTARLILEGIRKDRRVIIIDWRYRLLVVFWRLIPSCIWLRLKVATKAD